jgi:hypothetical protein
MQTPEAPDDIALSTISSVWMNELLLGPPAINTGMGTPEQTSAKDAASPVHGTLAT